MKHLVYWCYGASLDGVKKHPQQVMKDLGITYKHSTPQSMVDQWQFWNCSNIPDKLPEYIEELKVSPLDVSGVSKELAIRIINND